jgi:lipopolysaccharide transport system ATP-binding protein
MEPAISVTGIGKRYQLGELRSRPTLLTEAVVETFQRGLRRAREPRRNQGAELWALKDVTFDIPDGEAVGVIGRNGSGKTTLLKILARITEPTTGRATIRGRLGAVIDVGTGFNQELNGRENIFLNGAILGMSRSEINAKFDEIVNFSGIEEFLDTPVKRYSAGMKVRLGFGVAAHLDPEVLLIDEVLAVGDAEFQAKSLARMTEIGRSGRTIIFVSHDMNAVTNLCQRAIWLDRGQIVKDGEASEVGNAYLGNQTLSVTPTWSPPVAPAEALDVVLHGMRLLDSEGTLRTTFDRAEQVVVEFDLDVLRSDPRLRIGFDVTTPEGHLLYRAFHDDLVPGERLVPPGRWTVRCEIPANLLNQGFYSIHARIKINQFRWCVQEDNVLQLEVTDQAIVDGRDQARPGVIFPGFEWELEAGPMTSSGARLGDSVGQSLPQS